MYPATKCDVWKGHVREDNGTPPEERAISNPGGLRSECVARLGSPPPALFEEDRMPNFVEDKEGMFMRFPKLFFLRHSLTPDTLFVVRLGKPQESLSFGVRSEDDVIKIIIDELRRM